MSQPVALALAQAASQPHSTRAFHEVWAWNLDDQFDAFLTAVAQASDAGAVVAIDVEFPGFLRREPRLCEHGPRYQTLRENVDRLWPIQIGVAVAGAEGTLRGVWCFNLRFDEAVDAHSEPSLAFLRTAGIDFPRHRAEGIEAAALGLRLANSSLVGYHGCTPWWLTFSGSYDLAYLLKLLTLGRPLPGAPAGFDKALSVYCPRRHELRDLLPRGSLENLGRLHGVQRHGRAHTAGSDALLTLELFLHLARAGGFGAEPSKSWGEWDLETWSFWDGYSGDWESQQVAARWPSPWEVPPPPPFAPHWYHPALIPPPPLVGVGGPWGATVQGDATRSAEAPVSPFFRR